MFSPYYRSFISRPTAPDLSCASATFWHALARPVIHPCSHPKPATTKSNLADLFLWARLTHERLLGQSWLVTSSTVAMIAIMSLGILMGLPRLRNSL
jgi:hypothetical protein